MFFKLPQFLSKQTERKEDKRQTNLKSIFRVSRLVLVSVNNSLIKRTQKKKSIKQKKRARVRVLPKEALLEYPDRRERKEEEPREPSE